MTRNNQTEPIRLFGQWYAEAAESDQTDPSIMSLATAGSDGRPSVRIVLLKEFDERGFVFYTNYKSRKAVELKANPHAAIVIHWQSTGKQVRIKGRIEMISNVESDRYFATRPRGSQLGAWASEQSQPVGSREELELALRNREREFNGGEVPRPPHWGGYRIVPERIEFWTNRENRMHDRIVYSRVGDRSKDAERFDNAKRTDDAERSDDAEGWNIERLSP